MVNAENDERFTEGVVTAVDQILSSDGGSLTKWNQVLTTLKDANIAYERVARVEEIMVHPCNRGGLGLNAHEVHKTLAVVRAVGADGSYQHKATAFEMVQSGEKQKAQLSFNQQLIDRSAGLLAPLTGRERLLSVANSHFSAGCRAIIAGCCTTMPSLQDPTGKLNLLQVTDGDPEFKRIIEQGWTWTVIPAFAEQLWPQLPDLAQNALNADQGSYTMASELQVMSTMAAYASVEETINWSAIIAKVKTAMPPCSSYLGPLVEFVKNYAGGPGAPIIKYLDGFAKEYGGNKVLGETFLQAVVAGQFPTSSSRFPFMRAACIACNLVSPKPKITDGIARLVVKTDITNLCRKDKLLSVTAAESLMADAWGQVQQACAEGRMDRPTCHAIFGKLQSRALLFLLGKLKDGPEKKIFKTLSEINLKFAEDVRTATAGTGEACDADVGMRAAGCNSGVQVTLEEQADPVWIARQNGFVVGKYYVDKLNPNNIFLLESFTATGVTFQLHALGRTHVEFELFDNLKSKYMLHRSKMQLAITDDITPHQPEHHAVMQMDLKRAALFSELMAAAVQHSQREADHLTFMLFPPEVRIKSPCKKGELKLLPVTDLGRLHSKRTSSSVLASDGKGTTFSIDAPQKVRDAEQSKWAPGSVFAAYWWVGTTTDETEATVKRGQMKVGKFTVPTFENIKALSVHDKLLVYTEPASEPASSSNKKRRAA